MDRRETPPKNGDNASSEPPEEAVRDGHFSGSLVAVTAKARGTVEEAIRRVENYERHCCPRGRARRPADRASFAATVEAIVCELVRHYIIKADGGVAIPLSKSILGRRNRYRPVALNTRLPHVLEVMASPELGLVAVDKGVPAQWTDECTYAPGRRTTIKPGPVLARWIDVRGLTLVDLGRSKAAEVIELRSSKTYRKGGKKRADLINYEDTAETRALRRDVLTLNEWLAAADISLDAAYDGPPVDISPAGRHLVRIFNDNSFKRGGRLARGFWLNWKKRYRRQWLRINGERIVEVDFAGMFAALAYIRAGHPPPDFDPYAVPPWGDGYRDGFKQLVNTLLNDPTKRKGKRWPEGISRDALPSGNIKELIAAVEARHPDIVQLFGTGVGLELQNIESRITMRAAASLIKAEIVALPLHDGWLCTEADAVPVVAAMEAAAMGALGLRLKVDVKGPW